MKKLFAPFLASLGLLTACDPADNIIMPPVKPTTGVLILSEGQYGSGDAVVSAFDKATKTLNLDAFGSANPNAKLGDVGQSMSVQGNHGYIVVNGSGKIEVVNLPDLKTAGTITGLSEPRYFTATSATRGYVTEWRGPYTGYLPGVLSVLDLTTNKVTKSIPVGRNPEQLVALNGKIYVPNSLDNTVSVIDEATGMLSSTITVADGPSSMVIDRDNNIWVLCTGFVRFNNIPPSYTEQVSAGTLVRINPGSNNPASQFKLTFPATSSPSQLRISPTKDQLYYSFEGREYQMSISASALPTTHFIKRKFSGFAIDPGDNTVYGAVAPSYSSNGRFVRYNPSGIALDSFDVKIGPNSFVFY